MYYVDCTFRAFEFYVKQIFNFDGQFFLSATFHNS